MKAFAFALLMCVPVLEGCISVSEPDRAPTITGSIVARDVRTSIGGPPTVHVKASSTDECGIIFLVRSSTKILRKSGGQLSEASEAALLVGTSVSVWTDMVLLSCPGQAGAEVVEILS